METAKSHRDLYQDCMEAHKAARYHILSNIAARGIMHVLVHYQGEVPITTCPKLRPFSSYSVTQSFHNLEVIFLIDCLTFRNILMVHKTLIKKKKKIRIDLTLLGLRNAFFGRGKDVCFYCED